MRAATRIWSISPLDPVTSVPKKCQERLLLGTSQRQTATRASNNADRLISSKQVATTSRINMAVLIRIHLLTVCCRVGVAAVLPSPSRWPMAGNWFPSRRSTKKILQYIYNILQEENVVLRKNLTAFLQARVSIQKQRESDLKKVFAHRPDLSKQLLKSRARMRPQLPFVSMPVMQATAELNVRMRALSRQQSCPYHGCVPASKMNPMTRNSSMALSRFLYLTDKHSMSGLPLTQE